MTRRSIDLKIKDIKAIRSLTRVLGKLIKIRSCYRNYTDEHQRQAGYHRVVETFGWGLKESKEYVESKYDYYM